MTVKVYCPHRDTILCKHYTHNHTFPEEKKKKKVTNFSMLGIKKCKTSSSVDF